MHYYKSQNGDSLTLTQSTVQIAAGAGVEIDEAEFVLLSQPGEPTPIELMTMARGAASRRVTAFSNAIRERIAASQHYLQAARWPIQLASAKAIKAGTAGEFETSAMAREVRLRGMGETVEQLADKVLANSLIFESVGAAVDGIERATMDKIAAYQGSDPAGFEAILTEAKQIALAEFLDIFTPFIGAQGAQTKAAQFFGEA